MDAVGIKIEVGGRAFGGKATRTATGWTITCEGRLETLTAAGRTIQDARAAMERQIAQRLKRLRA